MKNKPLAFLKVSETHLNPLAYDAGYINKPEFITDSTFYYTVELKNESELIGIRAIRHDPFLAWDARMKKYKRAKPMKVYLWKFAEELMKMRDLSNRKAISFEIVKFDEAPEKIKEQFN